jgi:hypothetical protein
MTKRELGFLLIGFGSGLVFAAVAVVELVVGFRHHMFIIGLSWRPASVLLALPLVFIAVGIALSRRQANVQFDQTS